MMIYDCEQGTPEWHSVRCGVPTSSEFSKIVTSSGDPSKQRTKYMYKLAGEFVAQMPEDAYISMAMIRGSELESEAREAYSFITGNAVQQVGFCLNDGDFKYGASPDGLVGNEGLVEIKCPSLAVHVEYVVKGQLPKEYYQQVQGQMLVTERDWVDFFSYYPGVKPLIVRVNRNEEFLGKLRYELEAFCEELEEIIEVIK